MRTAVVGAGAISAVHVNALLSQGRRVDFICDTDAEKARALNERFSLNAEIYTDYETLIESGKVDVAHICTPHFLHAPMVVRALGKGVHVLCEKPLCICEEELREILRAEKHSSARLGVCFQNRYNASTEYVINALKARKITAAAGSLFWKRGEEYYHSAPWRGKFATEGGAALINQAIHTLDLLSLLCGGFDHVTANNFNMSLQTTIEAEDSACALLEKGGLRCNLFATVSAGADFPAEIKLMTDKGLLSFTCERVEDGNRIMREEEIRENAGKKCYGNGHAALIADFYGCAETGRKFSVDGGESAKTMRLVFAVYRSENRRVSV